MEHHFVIKQELNNNQASGSLAPIVINIPINIINNQKYNYLTEAYENLTDSNRAKVLSLIAKLLKEQENQK